MDLLLAKLFPPLFYPLSLACWALLFALFRFWRAPKQAAIALVTALTLLLLSGNDYVTVALLRSLEEQYLPPKPIPHGTAIVVLGGVIVPQQKPRPWVEVTEGGDRLLYGIHLFQQGYAPYLILSGGRIPWLGEIFQRSEAADMAEIAQVCGIPKENILLDTTSLNTYENARNVKALIEAHQIQGDLLLVTSAYHMPRAVAIFRHLGLKVIPVPTDYRWPSVARSFTWQNVLLSLIPTASNIKLTTDVLREYQGLLIYKLRGWL
ncbi:MAG: YdcF family protein [Thermosynechococcus sp. Uc]|uniref:YdcF family protein n=1 Tax=Thermosynechococcus sp. Uc TaxID=3034853 RepID=UPI0019EBE1EA|nr:YdcF family protein [Thermosynechococcus sp. Uc]MDM7325649.1 YdcF family protein [Thermosynechococcus sp. Uc]HIK26410.1 YdcF family protein [Thermosynechococcus sp. M46_R2017_013]